MVKTRRLSAVLALAVCGAVAGGAALAHEVGKVPNTPGGKAFLVRHEKYKQLGAAFKETNDELKKGSPNKALIARNAVTIKTLGAQVNGWFPKGSGPEGGIPTDAKPNVWTDPAGFAAAAQRLQVESAKFQQVAAGGDISAIKAQAGQLGQACKSCHQKYRVERD